MTQTPHQLTENIQVFRTAHPDVRVVDAYRELLEELFLIRHPEYKFNKNYVEPLHAFMTEVGGGQSLETHGNWFFFPWSNTVVHFLPSDWHQELRTARNKNLITADEQETLYGATIAVAGLSVGSHPASTLAMMNIGSTYHIADADVVSGSNTNRIRVDFTHINEPKCDLIAQYMYQLNPYATVHTFDTGVTEDTLDRFLTGVHVLVEEVDNLEMKIRLRLEAKKRRIPVVMATDNGDNVIVDIERYDLDPDLKIFNGLVGDLTIEEFQQFPPHELPKLAAKIVGPHLIVPRMMASLGEVGKTLYSWPQLGDAATLSGVAVTYVVKRILLGLPVKTGKLEINLDAIFDPTYGAAHATP